MNAVRNVLMSEDGSEYGYGRSVNSLVDFTRLDALPRLIHLCFAGVHHAFGDISSTYCNTAAER